MKDTPISQEVINAQHAILESLAHCAETKAYAQNDALFAEALKEHKEDKEGFNFQCSRWGNWLRISSARMGNPVPESYPWIPQTFSIAVNLDTVNTISLNPGYPPNKCGSIGYSFCRKDNMGNCSNGTNDGNYPPSAGYHYEVSARLPDIPTARPLFRYDGLEQPFCYPFGYDRSYQIQHKTVGFTQIAQDDSIVLSKVGVLYTPATMGSEVLNQILAAKDTLKTKKS